MSRNSVQRKQEPEDQFVTARLFRRFSRSGGANTAAKCGSVAAALVEDMMLNGLDRKTAAVGIYGMNTTMLGIIACQRQAFLRSAGLDTEDAALPEIEDDVTRENRRHNQRLSELGATA